MDHFQYRDGSLFCENASITSIAARVGTPVYVYSRKTFEDHYRGLTRAFAELNPLVRFSVKSCSNVHILRVLSECGAGMDVVSGGELERALSAGVAPENICFAGVGKTAAELRRAIDVGVGSINVESEQELDVIEVLARELDRRVTVALRLNPDVADERTHVKTTTGKRGNKFGIDRERIEGVFEAHRGSSHVAVRGLHFHIGSPIYSADPYVRAVRRVLTLIDSLREKSLIVDSLNLGGGFMADYGSPDVTPRKFEDYATPISELLRPFLAAGGRCLLEPGRTISANAGILVTELQYLKQCGDRQVAVVDTGMTHLTRPAMYDAEHFIWPVQVGADYAPRTRDPRGEGQGFDRYDVVGPICESSDRLGVARALPPLNRGDLLAVFSAGAYGMAMASQYNSVPRPPEVLVSGAECTLIRRRETYQDLVAPELSPEVL